MDPTLKLLRDLVAIDSRNPSLAPGAPGEGEIAEAIACAMRGIGLDVEVQNVVEGRPNVVGVLESRKSGRSLMFCGHTDTVGVEGMAAPFDPVERDGRLYGRGSQDMKGGVAAMIGAARRIAESGGLAAGRLIVAAVIDEEYESLGARALIKTWRADAAVVTEPTDLAVAVGHKGFAWLEVRTEGRAAHGSRPAEGRDAIFRMGRVLARLEALDRALQSRAPHPRLGVPSLHASIIEGGRELSSYPDGCVLKIERRTVTGETVEQTAEEVAAILAELRAEDPEFRGSSRLMVGRSPYEIAENHEVVTTIERVLAELGRRSARVGVSFWTDAAELGEAGTPTVIFGPGGAGLHSAEEYVRLDDVSLCRDALAALAQVYCADQG